MIVPADRTAQRRAYRCALAAVLPLALVVVSFFLPVVGVSKASPSPWLDFTPSSLVWLIPWPVYGMAALLAVTFAVAGLRGSVPGETARGAALFGLVASVLWALPYAGFLAFGAAGSNAVVLAPLPFAPIAAAIWAFMREKSHRGWVRWGWLLLSYACSTLPLLGVFLMSMSTAAHGAVLALVSLGFVLFFAIGSVLPPGAED